MNPAYLQFLEQLSNMFDLKYFEFLSTYLFYLQKYI